MKVYQVTAVLNYVVEAENEEKAEVLAKLYAETVYGKAVSDEISIYDLEEEN